MQAANSVRESSFDRLTLSRATLYEAIFTKSEIRYPISEIGAALDDLRCSGRKQYLPLGLLTRAWLRSLRGDAAGARADLDEAWDIAERGPMRLHMADIHLHRARLFFRENPYPWESPEADLAAAEKLIKDCGYHRRDRELADAKRATLPVTVRISR